MMMIYSNILLALVFGTANAFVQPKPSFTRPSAVALDSATEASNAVESIWQRARPVRVEGESLRTWPVPPPVYGVHVSMKTEGRPITSKIDLWNGPDYTPTNIKVYTENGAIRPFNSVIWTPLDENTIAVYNKGQGEFPVNVVVEHDTNKDGLTAAPEKLAQKGEPRLVQGGGTVTSYQFESNVESVQILLKTQGRNLKARIELLQGPNNNKQIMEFYTSDGKKRQFYAVVETPGAGNVVRIVNSNTVEYPFTAYVEPYMISKDKDFGVVIR